MSDYNVNMKKFNGTDYDNILPMSYLAKTAEKLEGGATSDIITQARNGLSQIATGSYVGNRKSSLQLIIGFKPKLMMFYEGKIIVTPYVYNGNYYKNRKRTGKWEIINNRLIDYNSASQPTTAHKDYWGKQTFFPFIIFDEEKPLYTHMTGDPASNGDTHSIYNYFIFMSETNGVVNFKEDAYGYRTYDWAPDPTYHEIALGFNISGTTYSYMAFS